MNILVSLHSLWKVTSLQSDIILFKLPMWIFKHLNLVSQQLYHQYGCQLKKTQLGTFIFESFNLKENSQLNSILTPRSNHSKESWSEWTFSTTFLTPFLSLIHCVSSKEAVLEMNSYVNVRIVFTIPKRMFTWLLQSIALKWSWNHLIFSLTLLNTNPLFQFLLDIQYVGRHLSFCWKSE